MIKTYPELPADITMEQFLRTVYNPTRWMTNFKYGYVPSFFTHDDEILRVTILEIRAAKLAHLRGLTRRPDSVSIPDSPLKTDESHDNNH